MSSQITPVRLLDRGRQTAPVFRLIRAALRLPTIYGVRSLTEAIERAAEEPARASVTLATLEANLRLELLPSERTSDEAKRRWIEALTPAIMRRLTSDLGFPALPDWSLRQTAPGSDRYVVTAGTEPQESTFWGAFCYAWKRCLEHARTLQHTLDAQRSAATEAINSHTAQTMNARDDLAEAETTIARLTGAVEVLKTALREKGFGEEALSELLADADAATDTMIAAEEDARTSEPHFKPAPNTPAVPVNVAFATSSLGRNKGR